MPLTSYQGLIEDDIGLGKIIASLGTDVVVVNTNAKAANDKDPWACLAGTGTNHGNVRPIYASRRTNFVDFFHVFRAGNATISTSAKLRCFGLVPPGTKNTKQNTAHGSIWPADADSNFTNAFGTFFVPLRTSDGTTEADFGTNAADMIYGSNVWGVQGPQSFYIAGCKLIVPLISQAASGPTASLLIARFST